MLKKSMHRWLVLLLLASRISAATWFKLDTPHFQILSQAGETALQGIARNFESAFALIPILEPAGRTATTPIRVFVFTSAKEFNTHRAESGKTKTGYAHGLSGSEVIAFLYAPDAAQRVAFHEYAHLVLHRGGGRLPLWLDEGLAEVYSEIQVGSGQATWGNPSAGRLAQLRSRRLLPASELFRIQVDSPAYNDANVAAFYYAQCWALAHMLNFGEGYRGRLPEFRRLLDSGAPESDAFARAFGKSAEAAMDDLQQFVFTNDFAPRLFARAPSPTLDGKAQPCPPEEVAFARADLLLRIGKTQEARQIYGQLSDASRAAPGADKALGHLALAQGNRDEAVRHYERSIGRRVADAEVYFEYAMLLRDRGSSGEQVRPLLERALALDPNLAGLQQFLGNRALDEGRHQEAVAHLERATALEPKNPRLWLCLALAYQAAENRVLAVSAARTAAQHAADPADIQMARATLDGLERPAQTAPLRSGPKTVVPDTWKNPEGDQRIEGKLVQVDCAGRAASLHVRAGGGIVVLSVLDPRKVIVRNTTGTTAEFRCGSFDALPVTIEYKSNKNEVTAIEFH